MEFDAGRISCVPFSEHYVTYIYGVTIVFCSIGPLCLKQAAECGMHGWPLIVLGRPPMQMVWYGGGNM